MNLKEQIMADVKTAMKNKEQEKLSTLRFLHAAIKNREIEIRPKEITDEEVLSVLKKLVKQRKDSIEQYEKASRQDLADKEKYELSVMEIYMPAQLGEEQVKKLVDEVLAATGASSMKDMGKVMKEVMAKSQGAADNRLVSDLVKAKLQ